MRIEVAIRSPSEMTAIESAEEHLKRYFGFADFRHGQAEVIRSVLEGRDTVVVMPTGSGKSLCYQLPAMLMGGLTLVISPLIALMKDQVDALAARGLPATFINSSLAYGEVIERLRGIGSGRFKLVYVAPERFRNEAFVRTIKDAHVTLMAVDEAHCISHWGYDFRPDYLNLRIACEVLGRPNIVALTAAATAHVRQDIVEQLGLRDPKVFITGFDRSNLALGVLHVSGEKEKVEISKNVISRSTGSGIIYTATRKSAEQVTSRLKMAGASAEAYHGGMSDDERAQAQNKFMNGEARAIVATNAFGMGIDKSDVRFVVHYHIPGSIEQYYQEVGRAGRDDAPAHCTLLFNYADTRTQQFFIEGSHPQQDFIERVFQAAVQLVGDRTDLTVQKISNIIGTRNEMSVRSALALLEKNGIVERGRPTDGAALVSLSVPVEAALGVVPVPSIEATVLDELVYVASISEREDTEIDLGRIAAGLGFGTNHIRGALAALAQRGIISYKTAFRGSGIRLLKQEAFEVIRDQSDLLSRASRSHARLRNMVEYCYFRGCLRRFVLDYFGDVNRMRRCGTCSSCDPKLMANLRPAQRNIDEAGVLKLKKPGSRQGQPDLGGQQAPLAPKTRARPSREAPPCRQPSVKRFENEEPQVQHQALSEPETLVIRKVLSCIARLNDRFGKGTIARVLAGVSSGEISSHALGGLPTFGALRDIELPTINRYIKALILAGCVEVNAGSYPTLRLSEFGREVMHGRAQAILDFGETQEI